MLLPSSRGARIPSPSPRKTSRPTGKTAASGGLRLARNAGRLRLPGLPRFAAGQSWTSGGSLRRPPDVRHHHRRRCFTRRLSARDSWGPGQRAPRLETPSVGLSVHRVGRGNTHCTVGLVMNTCFVPGAPWDYGIADTGFFHEQLPRPRAPRSPNRATHRCFPPRLPELRDPEPEARFGFRPAEIPADCVRPGVVEPCTTRACPRVYSVGTRSTRRPWCCAPEADHRHPRLEVAARRPLSTGDGPIRGRREMSPRILRPRPPAAAVIHSDITPRSILLTRRSASSRVHPRTGVNAGRSATSRARGPTTPSAPFYRAPEVHRRPNRGISPPTCSRLGAAILFRGRDPGPARNPVKNFSRACRRRLPPACSARPCSRPRPVTRAETAYAAHVCPRPPGPPDPFSRRRWPRIEGGRGRDSSRTISRAPHGARMFNLGLAAARSACPPRPARPCHGRPRPQIKR